jgi:cysteine-rich repeat protein
VSELCGNNILDPIEVCDDNNVMSGDGCRGDCRGLEICGDGLLDVMEECDDMNTDDADGCEGDCTRPACGNGIVDPGEICLPTAASSTHTVGGMPGRIAVGRLDADDSDWDLVVPSGMADNVTILFGVGNGTFTAVNYAAGDGSLSVTLGDLDNDGDVDLATSDGTVGTVTVLYNFFDQFDSTRQTVSLPQPPRPAVVAANLDGDAALEIAVAGEGGVRILNRGSDNLYSIATTIAMSDAPVAIAAGRIDGDGDVDLVVARPDASPPRTTVLRNDGSAMFPSGMAIDTNDTAGPVDVILANIDGDGDLDIITANLGSDNVTVQGNDGTGAAASLVRFSVGDGPEAVFAADYDNDGDLDLATINQNQAGYTILAGNGAGVFTMALQRALCSGQSLAAGDFDNDGAVDVAMVCNNVRILVANP